MRLYIYTMLFTLIVSVGFFSQLAKADGGTKTLTPYDQYLGDLPDTNVCTISLGPGTVLTSFTRLGVSPPVEIFGPGSQVNRGDGLTCGPCAVWQYVFGATGETVFSCDIGETKF